MKFLIRISVIWILSILPFTEILSAKDNISITNLKNSITEKNLTEKYKNDSAQIKNVTVVYPVVMPPYTFEDEKGEAQGMAIELLRLWSKKTGIEIRFKSAPWDKSLKLMQEEKADIHASLYYTEERDNYMDYASIVASSHGCIFFNKNIINIKGFNDLIAYRVGVVRGSFHEDYMQKNHPEIKIVSYLEFPQMLNAAQNGEIHVFIDDLGATIYRLKQKGLINEFRYNKNNELYRNNFWFAVAEGDSNLVSAIRKGITLITPEERAAIERKWLETSIIKTNDILEIAIQSDFAPYTFINPEGQASGMFIDIWRLWGKKTGKTINFRPSSWNESFNSLRKGEVDIHSGMFYSDSRSKWIEFSNPFYETGSGLFNLSSQNISNDLSKLSGLRIGVVKSSFQEEYIQTNYPNIERVQFETIEQMLRAVQTKDISACLSEIHSTKNLINRLGLSGFFNADVKITFNSKFRVGVLKGNKDLIALINKGFDAISINEFSDIEEHWVPDSKNQYYKNSGHKITLTEKEQEWLKNNNTIRVSFWQHPPYFYLQDGIVIGIAVDLLNEISENTGIKFQYENKMHPFSSVLLGLKEHEGPDLVGAIMPTAEREKSILFTKPYINSPRFIFTRDDDVFISSMDKLLGKKVAVVNDYAVHKELMEKYPEIDLLVCTNNEEALRAVSLGKATAFIGDLVSTPAMINEFGLHNLKAACPSGLADHPLAMGIRDDWPDLQNIISKSLEAIPADEKAAIINKWTTVRIEYGMSPDKVMRWGFIFVGGIVLIIVLFSFWNRSLKRQVSKRTFELSDSEKRFRATFEQAAVGIAHVALDGKFLRLNQRFCDIVGYTYNEMLNFTFADITFPDDLEEDNKNVRLLLADEIKTYAIDKRYIHKKGTLVWVNLTVSLVRDEFNNPLWFVSVVKDVSERKLAEQKLKVKDDRLTGIIDSISDSMTMLDKDLNIVWANKKAKRIFGSDIDKKKCHLCFHKKEEACESCLVKKSFADSKVHMNITELFIKSGAKRIFECVSNVAAYDEHKAPNLVVLISRDITVQQLASENIKESEEKYRTLVEQAQDGICIVQDDKIKFVNSYLAELTGYTIHELQDSTFIDHISSDELTKIIDIYKRRLNHESVPSIYESKIVCKNGANLDVEFNASLSSYNNKPANLIIVRDISERKETEKKILNYQQRLKALSLELTISEEQQRKQIAVDLHDHVGQLLAASRIQIANIYNEIDRTDTLSKLKDISQGILQAIKATRSAIFDLSPPQLNEIGLFAAVSDWIEEQVQLKYGILTVLTGDDQIYSLEENIRYLCFRSIRELLMNIVKHAQATKININIEKKNENLIVTITDNGIGFNYDSSLLKLKSQSFGLFSIQERMNDIGGSMDIQSIIGNGTSVKLEIPLNDKNG